MKKLLLACLLAIPCLFAHAQVDLQKKWFVGGQVSYHSIDDPGLAQYTSGYDLKQYHFLPTVGTFISSSVAVGLSVGYQNSKYTGKDDNNWTSKYNNIDIQPFTRKYWNITKGLYFFGEAALPISFGNSKGILQDTEVYKMNTTHIGLRVSPGFDYFINDWISIETKFTLFSATYTEFKPKEGDSTTNFRIGADTNANQIGDLTIGVKFLF